MGYVDVEPGEHERRSVSGMPNQPYKEPPNPNFDHCGQCDVIRCWHERVVPIHDFVEPKAKA